jgi:glycosyltransferase involved in cell wall biosynthesis
VRILHIIDTFSPVAGGPPEAVRLLVKGYQAIGADIEVLCLDSPESPFLHDIPCVVHALNQSFLGKYAFSPRLWRWLGKNARNYDGIVMNGIWTFPGLCLYLRSRRTEARYGIFTHGALDPWFKRKYPLKHLKKMIYWPIQHAILHGAEAVFFTTRTERDLAQTSFWPSKWNSVVVPYGIFDPELDGGNPQSQIDAFYRRIPELRGRRFLLFLGRIHEKKGCDLLLKAFAKLVGDAPEVDLVMAGPDQMGMQAKLASLAGRLGAGARVHWAGMISGEVKWGALRSCDALVLPSHQENFGICVVEALSVGRPVLISNQVNIWHQIEEDKVGLVEDDTLSGTEKLLQRWFNLAPAERDAMARQARPCFLGRFNMSKAAEAINAIFASNPPTRMRRIDCDWNSHVC